MPASMACKGGNAAMCCGFWTWLSASSFRGDDHYMAIPFFPSRHFRHGNICVHRDSASSQPADLRGKKVGIPSYRMTAAVW
jgi:4,5-dihydroxyphthalate decarboxylase